MSVKEYIKKYQATQAKNLRQVPFHQPGRTGRADVFGGGNIHYDIGDWAGGIYLLAKRTELMKTIDENLELLKRHLPLYLINCTGNYTSNYNAAEHINKAIDLCRRGGFKKILMISGDTDFSQTKHLDQWDDQNARFVFGIEYCHETHRWMCFLKGSKCRGIHCDVENDRLYNIYPFPTTSGKFPITISALS